MEEVAKRYASAIVSIAKDEGRLEDYKSAILLMRNSLDANPKLFSFLKSYFVKEVDKHKVIDEITKPTGLVYFANYIKLLCQKHKIYLYKDIFKEAIKQLNYELNILEGFVYSVEPLENSKIHEICKAISRKLDKKVELVNKIDERLIGGVRVVIHDSVFDGSIKHKLETMKEELKERRNG